MSAFLKTLFGDRGTVAVVTIVMIAEVLLIVAGQTPLGAYLVPPLIMAGVAWLATQ